MTRTPIKPRIVYHYRGQVERPTRLRSYAWCDGYSTQGAHGPRYPWMTRAECIADAKGQGAIAVFVHGTPETVREDTI